MMAREDAPPIMVLLKKFLTWGVMALVGLGIGCILCVVWALAWIAFRPLPHIPHLPVAYSIADCGPLGSDEPDPYQPAGYNVRLSNDGKIVRYSDEDTQNRRDAQLKANKAFLKRKGLIGKGGAINYYSDDVVLADNGDALLDQFQGPLYKKGQFIPISKGIRGYDWKIFEYRFDKLNSADQAVGTGRIATALASSGGTSSPHGRHLPVIWSPFQSQVEDLNSLIDASSGWYLDQAADINDRGQILCIGRQIDERGAEQYPQNAHWLVLTPKT